MKSGFSAGVSLPLRAVVLLTGLAAPGMALAAPFCISNQALSPLCIYNDPADCQRDATRQQAACSVNMAEVTLPRGIGQYCVVVGSGIAQCIYTDRQTCEAAAKRQHGACSETALLAPSRAPDPYGQVEGPYSPAEAQAYAKQYLTPRKRNQPNQP
jgi:hypothetical protein